jgi:TolB-like protein
MHRTGHIILILLLTSWALLFNGCAPRSKQTADGREISPGEISANYYFRQRWWNYYQRGVESAETRNYSGALADFKAAMGQRSDDRRMARTYGMHFIDYFPSRELGIVYFETDRLEEAREALQRSLDSYPSAKAHFYLDRVRRAIIEKSGAHVAPPEVRIAPDDEEIRTNRDPVVVQGTARDPNFVQGVTVNGVPIYMEGAQRKVPFESHLDLAEGDHEVVIRAENLMGSATRRKVVIHVDRQGPMIVITHIDRFRDSTGYAHDIQGVVTDNSGVLQVQLDGVSFNSTAREVPFHHRVPAGERSVRINARDHLGNTTTADVHLNEDTQCAFRPTLLAAAQSEDDSTTATLVAGLAGNHAPEIILKEWQATQTVYLDKVYIDGMARDADNVVELSINNVALIQKPGRLVYFNHLMRLDPGSNVISILAVDSRGNRTATQFTIIRKVPAALQLDARLKVSVLPFDKQVDTSTEGVLFQDYLLNALIRRERFRLVERNLLDVILREQKLSQSALIDQQTALRVGRMAAAQSIITGTIVESRNGIEIVSRMVDTETSDILAMADVYGEHHNRQTLKTLAEGMAIKYHREFPLVDGTVVDRRGTTIITDLGKEDIKLQRRILVYRESPVRHPADGRLLGMDKEILCRARIIMVEGQMSKARLMGTPSGDVQKFYKVITE